MKLMVVMPPEPPDDVKITGGLISAVDPSLTGFQFEMQPNQGQPPSAIKGTDIAVVDAKRNDLSSSGGPLSPLPVVPPRTEFVYEAMFQLGPTQTLGQGPLGERRMVPILGGRFEGPRLKGTVLPGGADRQLIRQDGARLLDALYELQADDGAVITVHNRVLLDTRPDGSPYAFSNIDITAPDGPHGWLNHLIFVGTLHPMRPEPSVLVRVYHLA